MTPDALHRELAEGTIRPAYLLSGAEALYRDDALTALRQAVLAGGPADFNHDRLEASGLTPGALLDAVRALPVLAERRLVELREPEERRGGGKALLDALTTAVEEVCGQPGTVLVVAATRPDRRARWVRAFREPAAVVTCEPPKGARELVNLAQQEARRLGTRLAPGAGEALAEAVGPQLLLLRRELEKAALHAGPDQPITRADVEATASVLAEEPVWDLTDAIGEGRTARALGVLHRLLEGGSPPPVLLGALASHFRKLARARAGRPAPGHPFAVRKLETQARRYPPARLLACLHAIHEVDEVLKGQGALEPELALERLVMGLSA